MAQLQYGGTSVQHSWNGREDNCRSNEDMLQLSSAHRENTLFSISPSPTLSAALERECGIDTVTHTICVAHMFEGFTQILSVYQRIYNSTDSKALQSGKQAKIRVQSDAIISVGVCVFHRLLIKKRTSLLWSRLVKNTDDITLISTWNFDSGQTVIRPANVRAP